MGLSRTCKVCDQEMSLEDFPMRTRGKYTYWLKTCVECHKKKERERSRKYKAKNREAVKRRERLDKSIRYETDEEYRELLRARAREYYRKNRKKVLAQKKAKRERQKRT